MQPDLFGAWPHDAQHSNMPTDPSEDRDDLGVLLDALDALVEGVAVLARRVVTREEQTAAGPWQRGTMYSVNDCVQHDGSLWRCVETHVSGAKALSSVRAFLGGATIPGTMPTRADVLREKTHKDDGVDLTARVFYTLQDEKALQEHRNSKVIALLMNHLHKEGRLSDDEIDDILLECSQ